MTNIAILLGLILALLLLFTIRGILAAGRTKTMIFDVDNEVFVVRRLNGETPYMGKDLRRALLELERDD